MALLIRDNRDPAPKPVTPTRAGDLFPIGKEKVVKSGNPMIAVRGFAAGSGVIRRWQRFAASVRDRQSLITNKLAMEDYSDLGLSPESMRILGRAGVLSADQLRELAPEALVTMGVPEEEVKGLNIWAVKERKAIAEAEAEDDLTTITGIGPGNATKIREAGYRTFEALRASTPDTLSASGLSEAVIDRIQDWLAEEKSSTEAKEREDKAAGPPSTKTKE